MSSVSPADFEKVEIQRLRDLLPASLRPLITIEPQMSNPSNSLIRLKPRPVWQALGTVQIRFAPWQSLPQPQRDLLFLREVGWFDTRNWLQPGLYQAIVVVGGLATLVELVQQNPVSVLLAGGMTGLAARQIWQNLNQETAVMNADEYAIRRAQFRGYDRQTAARHLLEGLDQGQKIDRTDMINVMRIQRLQAIAQSPASQTSSSSGDS